MRTLDDSWVCLLIQLAYLAELQGQISCRESCNTSVHSSKLHDFLTAQFTVVWATITVVSSSFHVDGKVVFMVERIGDFSEFSISAL